MRTLKRSLIGTSGPDTALFRAGFDSRRTAGDFGRRGLRQLAPRVRYTLHLSLRDEPRFLLALLKWRGHTPLLTAAGGERPARCRPSPPLQNNSYPRGSRSWPADSR